MMNLLTVYLLEVSPLIGKMEVMRRTIIDGKLAAFGSVAAMAAGLLCAVALLKLSHDYLQGQGITLWQVLRPIVLLLLCCNFNSFVVRPIHSICNIFTRGMCNQVNLSAAAYAKALGDSYKIAVASSLTATVSNFEEAQANSAERQASVTEENTPSKAARFWAGVKNFFLGAGDYIVAAGKSVVGGIERLTVSKLLIVVESILLLVMKAVLMGQQIYAYIQLVIIALVGPFVFALAIIPSFSHSISSWIARYIQIAFWIPVGQLIMFINYKMLLICNDFAMDYDLGGKLASIVALIVAILSVKSVPTIASYIIESAGTGGAEHSVTGSFSSIGSAAVGAATSGMMGAKLGK